MPRSGTGASTKRRQRAKRERSALRLLCKSIEQQVRLAYAKVPREATALSQVRLDMRASLVSRGVPHDRGVGIAGQEGGDRHRATACDRADAERAATVTGGSPYTGSTSRSSCAITSSWRGKTSCWGRSSWGNTAVDAWEGSDLRVLHRHRADPAPAGPPAPAQRQDRDEGLDGTAPQLPHRLIRHAIEHARRDPTRTQSSSASWRRTWAMIGSGVDGIWAKGVRDSMGRLL